MIGLFEENEEILILIIQGVGFLGAVVTLGRGLISLNMDVKRNQISLKKLSENHDQEKSMRQRQVQNLDGRLGRVERSLWK